MIYFGLLLLSYVLFYVVNRYFANKWMRKIYSGLPYNWRSAKEIEKLLVDEGVKPYFYLALVPIQKKTISEEIKNIFSFKKVPLVVKINISKVLESWAIEGIILSKTSEISSALKLLRKAVEGLKQIAIDDNGVTDKLIESIERQKSSGGDISFFLVEYKKKNKRVVPESRKFAFLRPRKK